MSSKNYEYNKRSQQGLLVKRLRRHPLTVESGVRFSYGSPFCYVSLAQLDRATPF